MISESSHTYFINGKARGVADSVLYEAIALRDIVRTRTGSAVPVLTLGHLAQLTNVDYAFLRRVIARSADPYFTIRINKRGGDRSKREISIPDRQLRWVQSWIHEHILSAIVPSQYSFAFFPGSSIYRCAEAHAGSRWLVKLDIRDFFHSVHEAQVYRIFRGLGYKSLMSFELARLCTRIPTRKDPKLLYRLSKHYHVYPNVSTQVPAGALPMGAPSSPLLSNIFMTDFDKRIGALMLREHVTYTRYADDLFFSSSASSFGRTDVHEIISLVRERLRIHGLRLNDDKIVVAPPGSRKIVLGLIVNGERQTFP